MNRESIHDPGTDPRIDRALQSVRSATPAPGFEGRILNRVAAARMTMDARPAHISWISRISALPRLPRQVLGVAAACLLGFVIVAGSVSHSRRIGAEHGTIAPPLPAAGQGIGAASAVHPAAPASTPAPAGQPGRALRSSRHGRARIAPHSRKAPGAVPAPPASKPASDSEN
ncbi:MAG: hypothetical protein ACLGXA_08660 [Acidobacteriota bacterium]